MKLITKALIAILLLTAFIPTKIGMLCLFSPEKAVAFFGLQELNPDIEKLLLILGCFVLTVVAFQVVAVIWLLKGKQNAISLSALVGVISIGRGILAFILFNSHNINDTRISMVPVVIGTLILVLSIVASKQNR